MNASEISRPRPEEAVPLPGTLSGYLSMVPDPRIARTRRHALGDILTTAVCAILCGYSSYYDMAEFCRDYMQWLRQWLPLEGGAPSHDTFRRVLGLVNPAQFQSAFRLWTRAIRGRVGDDQIAVDGKALRGCPDADGGVVYIVNAWSASSHLVLGQVAVREKENEIVAIPRLLPLLDIRGGLVSIDAIGCQGRIAAGIRERGADYFLALKGNQPTARAEMEGFLVEAAARGDAHVDRFETLEKGHGRIERRVCHVSRKIGWFEDLPKWKDLRCVAMVEATRTVRGVEGAVERRLYLSSRALTARQALEASRAHWGVEGMHWVMDVIFDEDRSRARERHAAENLATIRRIVNNILRVERDRGDPERPQRLKQLMRRAARFDDFRKSLLRVFCQTLDEEAQDSHEEQ